MRLAKLITLRNTRGHEFQDVFVLGPNYAAVIDGVTNFETPWLLINAVKAALSQYIVPSRRGVLRTINALIAAAKDKPGACTIAFITWKRGPAGYAIHGAYAGDSGVALLRGGKIIGMTFNPVEVAHNVEDPNTQRGNLDSPFGFGVLWRYSVPESFSTFSFLAKFGDEVLLFTDGGRDYFLYGLKKEHGDITQARFVAAPQRNHYKPEAPEVGRGGKGGRGNRLTSSAPQR